MLQKPSFSASREPDPGLDFTDDELDTVYTQLSSVIREQIDVETYECLTAQNYANIRPGSVTWLRVQRRIMQAKLTESIQRESESEMGV